MTTTLHYEAETSLPLYMHTTITNYYQQVIEYLASLWLNNIWNNI